MEDIARRRPLIRSERTTAAAAAAAAVVKDITAHQAAAAGEVTPFVSDTLIMPAVAEVVTGEEGWVPAAVCPQWVARHCTVAAVGCDRPPKEEEEEQEEGVRSSPGPAVDLPAATSRLVTFDRPLREEAR